MSAEVRPPTRVVVALASAAELAAVMAALAAEPAVTVVAQLDGPTLSVATLRKLRADLVIVDLARWRVAEGAATLGGRVLLLGAEPGVSQLELTREARSLGAVELIAAPPAEGAVAKAWAEALCATVRWMAEIPVVGMPPPGRAAPVRVVGMVGSTGALPVVSELLVRLKPACGAPVLLVQHVLDGLTQPLARWLAGATGWTVSVARAGERAEPGVVYLAQDGHDFAVDAFLRIHVVPAEGEWSAAGDRLLRALARTLGPAAAGVVLSGMGEDGARGLLALRRAGGPTLAQSEDSCVVAAMPRAAAALGAVGRALPPPALGDALAALLSQPVPLLAPESAR